MMEIRLVVNLYQDGGTLGKLIVPRSTRVDTLWTCPYGAIAQTKIGDGPEPSGSDRLSIKTVSFPPMVGVLTYGGKHADGVFEE